MDATEYWRGRDFAAKSKYTAADVAGFTPTTDFERGLVDQANGRDPQVPRPAAAPPPVVAPPYTGPPAQPGPRGEVVIVMAPPPAPVERYLELAVSIAGKRVRLDTLYDLRQLGQMGGLIGLVTSISRALARVRILGAGPADWREGYRLAGPTGPIAAYVHSLQLAGQLGTPQDYGLSAWVGTRTRQGGRRGGIRLLSAEELRALGFNPRAL
jgi:hypothetical protein